MLLLLVLLILCIFILCWVALRSRQCHKSLVESFKAEDDLMHHDISEDEKYIYFLIIDLYQKNLNRDPHEEELRAHFDSIRSNDRPLSDIYNEIVNTEEYNLLHNEDSKHGRVHSTKQDIDDYDFVHTTLMEMMPEQQKIFYEKNDRTYTTYLVSKYREFGRDKVQLKKYIVRTPEYVEYIERSNGTVDVKEGGRRDEEIVMIILKREVPAIHKRALSDAELRSDMIQLYVESSRSKVAFVEKARAHPENTSQVEPGSTLVTESSTYVINRPDIRKSSSVRVGNSPSSAKATGEGAAAQESGCEFFKKAQYLNNVQNRRNLEDQKYMCEMSKMYENVSEDMTLAPGHEWSVPQKRAPVCHTQAACDMHASRDQTSLIGTVLDSVNDRILPSFEYKENL